MHTPHLPHLDVSDVALAVLAAIIEAALIGRWIHRRMWGRWA